MIAVLLRSAVGSMSREIVMGGRRFSAGSLALVLLVPGLTVTAGSASAEPPSASASDRPSHVSHSIERTRAWRQVTGGETHTCGIRRDHSLWCWGGNDIGQLGLGDTKDRLVPRRVGTDADWARVEAGFRHTCGIRAGGSLWCWGWNLHGELGLGDTRSRLLP